MEKTNICPKCGDENIKIIKDVLYTIVDISKKRRVEKIEINCIL